MDIESGGFVEAEAQVLAMHPVLESLSEHQLVVLKTQIEQLASCATLKRDEFRAQLLNLSRGSEMQQAYGVSISNR